MVDLGKRRKRGETEMDVGPERSRPLHNFKLPHLKWGSRRVLRCMMVPEDPRGGGGVSSDRAAAGWRWEGGSIGRRRGEKRESRARSPERKSGGGGWGKPRPAAAEGYDGGFEAVRAKLMFDLQAAADRMKDAILREGLEEEDDDDEPIPGPVSLPAESYGDERPWNLRTRRAACKATNGANGATVGGGGSGGGGCGGGVNGGAGSGLSVVERKEADLSPRRNESGSPRLAGVFAGEKREKFSVSLSRREIEEDFRALTGNRPPRRPKKRPKIVQKELDTLFPGLWLTEVTADMYKVPDAPET